MCRLCTERGKTWIGDDAICGFDRKGIFTIENWNCATLNELRDICEEVNRSERKNDLSFATLNIEDEGWIVLSWYKNHGRVSYAEYICDEIHELLSLEIAEKAINQYRK